MTEKPGDYLEYCQKMGMPVNFGYYQYLLYTYNKHKLTDEEKDRMLYNLVLQNQKENR